MENKIKSNKKLKKEFERELQEMYPNAFETIDKTIRIKQDNNFCKLMYTNLSYNKILIEKIWVAYIGYLHILLNSLTYEGVVNFNSLKDLWIKDGMIKVCKKKFIDNWIVKKYRWDFYMNPIVAIKWETINQNLIKLFE